MLKFINPHHGADTFIDPYRIVGIIDAAEHGSLVYAGEGHAFAVRETPTEVLAMLEKAKQPPQKPYFPGIHRPSTAQPTMTTGLGI
jgi:hypothetical protein